MRINVSSFKNPATSMSAARSKAKVGESAMTVRELAKEAYGFGAVTMELVDPGHSGWKAQLTASPAGNLIWAMRMSEKFEAACERFRAQRKGKSPNLRTQAATMREQKPEEAHALATWWGNNEGLIKAHVGDAVRYDQLLGMFLRGPTHC